MEEALGEVDGESIEGDNSQIASLAIPSDSSCVYNMKNVSVIS